MFYIKRSKVTADGQCPVMCRMTVNGTLSAFSCKLNVHPKTWDYREKKRCSDALNALDDHWGNIKAQVRKQYQNIGDREVYVAAAKVVKAYPVLAMNTKPSWKRSTIIWEPLRRESVKTVK